MKAKIMFLLAAFMLLFSVSANAQNSETPIKGDVNGDGVVDIADINAIIDIMKNSGETPVNGYYWYAGHNASDTYITASNYTSIASQVTTPPASTDINPTDTYVYVVAPKTATVRVYDPVMNVDVNMKTFNSSTGTYTNAETEVGDYKIYRSAQLVLGLTRIDVQPNYYWYIGQTDPSTMTDISPIVTDNSSPGWRLIGTTLPTYSASNKLWNATDIITTSNSLTKQYIAVPAESTACPRDGAGNDGSTVDIYNKLPNVTIAGVEYKVYESVGKMRRFNLDIY